MLQNFFKGHRLNSTVIKYTHAYTGIECIMKCMDEDKSCRSVNFLKKTNFENNCEFLQDISSEKLDLLLESENYDYYILLSPNRVSTKPVATELA